MRRPNKPHREGYEDEEDCEGYYDPDEAERRDCYKCWARHCSDAWHKEEERKQQVREDAMTPEEKLKRDEFLAGLRKLY